MRAARYFAAVDSHTEGMPTRVITGGVGPVPGATMLERKLHFEAELDELRLLLMREPRGHGAMSGAILQPPTRPDADWGVLFIEVSGLLPMCGHGTIGVATVLVETGMVAVTEPETVIRLDVPAGLVEARVRVENGRAQSVTIRNVPSFLHTRDRVVDVPGYGEITYDMAFGGNFYAITPAADAGLVVDPARNAELVEAGLAVMAAINAADRPVHPARRADQRLPPRRLPRAGPRRRRRRRRHLDPPGLAGPLAVRDGHERADGAAARARASSRSGADFVNESVIGTRFTGRLVEETTVGRRAGGRSRRSRAAPGSPAWASTCSTPRTRSRRASPSVEAGSRAPSGGAHGTLPGYAAAR